MTLKSILTILPHSTWEYKVSLSSLNRIQGSDVRKANTYYPWQGDIVNAEHLEDDTLYDLWASGTKGTHSKYIAFPSGMDVKKSDKVKILEELGVSLDFVI